MEWTGFVFNHLEILQIEQDTYYFQKLEIKDYTVVVHEINAFDQPVKNNIKIYGSIRKIATGQGNNCTTGCLPYFK